MSGVRKLIGKRFACMPHVIASITCIPLMKKDMLQGMVAWLQGSYNKFYGIFCIQRYTYVYVYVVSLIIPFLGPPSLITELTVVPAVPAAKEITQGTTICITLYE